MSGGVSEAPYQGAPLPGYEERALDATSLGRGLVSDDGVGPLRLTRRRDPGPRPTKGFVPLYSGPEVGTDDGAVWSQWSPTKGPAAGGGEHSLMTGHATRERV